MRVAERRPVCGQRGLLVTAGLLAAAWALLVAGCSGGDGDDGGSSFRISLSVTEPPAGSMDVVWLAPGGIGGTGLVVDVVARGISDPFDGFNVEIQFDPLVAEAVSLAFGTVLDGCGGLDPVKLDNVSNGNANTSGTIIISAALPVGPAPPACALPGMQALARIGFRERSIGTSPLSFVPFNGDANSPAGSRLFRRGTMMAEIPVNFFDGQALIEVTP